MMKTKIAAAAFGLLSLGALANSASAMTPWQAHHPRRVEVNERLAHQNYRINHAYREGEISRAQAVRLHREDHAIRREERIDARFNGGHLTRAEQRTLNHQENQVSRQIG